jgi:VWFA-related protein
MRWWAGVWCAIALAQDPAPIRVDVNVVSVACSVRTRDGALVNDLEKSGFEVREDGVPQNIRYFGRRLDLPLTIGLLLDYSGSQRWFIHQHQDDAIRFLRQVIQQRDQVFVAGFERRIRLIADLTGSVDFIEGELTTALRDLRGFPVLGPPERRLGGTAFHDAVFHAARQKMRAIQGRKAMVILTDGIDQGSIRKLPDAIEAAQGADATVYCIQYRPGQFGFGRFTVKAGREMKKLVEETGGRLFDANEQEMPHIFQQIDEELRSMYELGYAPKKPPTGRTFRKIEVKVKRPGLKVRARRGYFPG